MNRAPYRIWQTDMPFRKNDTPVVGTMGSSVHNVIIMDRETFMRLVRENPDLSDAEFELARV